MMPHPEARSAARRRTWLKLGCAIVALAAVTGPLAGAAHGQAFEGTPTVVAGAVSFDRSTPGVETITVVDDAIVNWTPVEGPGGVIDFLPAGNTATFQDSAGEGFVILNRILPAGTGIVQLNGNVIGQLQTAAGTVTGGLVAFYSPTGILVGSSAIFDVGSLILTAADPNPATFQDFGNGNGALSLAAAPGSTARVEVLSGATITASSENSFLAIVAPQVIMDGAVRVNGSTAYVAAEAVDLTLVNGLFDIVVTTGTSVANAIIHSGSTGGPARTGTDANQAIYAVGVGQGQAVQLLFSGNLGFDPATDASIVNGEIILSAGSNVEGRSFSTPANAGPADLIVRNATVTSDFAGSATRDAILVADGAGDLVFEHDVVVHGDGSAGLYASGGRLEVAGDAIVSADAVGIGAGADATAGRARILAENGGSLAIQGNATVTANATGGDGSDGGAATAGSAGIVAIGGDIQIGGAISIAADAVGGDASVGFGGEGGAAQGGTAFVQAEEAGSIGGNVAALSVNGTGGVGGAGDGASIAAGAGGEGRGGLFQGTPDSGGAFVLARIDQGAVSLTDVTLEAIGSGGAGGAGGVGQAGGAGGAAFGGTAQIGSFRGDATGGPQGADTQIVTAVTDASAVGGAGGQGPSGQGAGGAATGGFTYLTAANGAQASVDALVLVANAEGGGGGIGGAAIGGQAGIAGAGAIDVATASLEALTTGGSGSNGSAGTATGGNIVVESTVGDGSSAGDIRIGSFTGDITSRGDAATSTAGTADLLVDAGEARFDSFFLSSAGGNQANATPSPSTIAVAGRLTFLDSARFEVEGDIAISTTGTGQILGGPDVGTPTGDLFFGSRVGTITIDGVDPGLINLGGRSLTLVSADLEIMDGASIGGLDVFLAATDAGGQVTLGGAGQGPGYTLTQAEAERIEAGRVEFAASDIVVRDLTIQGTPTGGPSSVTLSGDMVSIQGALEYVAGPGDTLEIDVEGGVLEVITPTGSISVNDGTNLAGRLTLQAGLLIVADADLAARIRADSRFDGLAEALATNTGPDKPEGYLQASVIEILFDGDRLNEVYIQNSGSDAAFGGTAARIPGLRFGLEEDGDGPVQVRLIGYGAGLDADGGVVTNTDYMNSVDFGEAQGVAYTDDSEFNAVYVTTGLPARPPFGGAPDEAVPVGSEVIFGPLTQVATFDAGEDEQDRAFGAAFPALIDTAELAIDPAIDQAVASGGDSAQWQAADDRQDEDEQEQ